MTDDPDEPLPWRPANPNKNKESNSNLANPIQFSQEPLQQDSNKYGIYHLDQRYDYPRYKNRRVLSMDSGLESFGPAFHATQLKRPSQFTSASHRLENDGKKGYSSSSLISSDRNREFRGKLKIQKGKHLRPLPFEKLSMFPDDESLNSFLKWKYEHAAADDTQLEENRIILSTLINHLLDDRSGAYKELKDIPKRLQCWKTYSMLIREFMIAKFSILRGKRFTGNFPWKHFDKFFKVENWPYKTFSWSSIVLSAEIMEQIANGLMEVKISRKTAFPDDKSFKAYLARKMGSDWEENREILRLLFSESDYQSLSTNVQKDLRSILIEDFLLAKYSILEKKRLIKYRNDMINAFVIGRNKRYYSLLRLAADDCSRLLRNLETVRPVASIFKPI